jgi:hypothetical protein
VHRICLQNLDVQTSDDDCFSSGFVLSFYLTTEQPLRIAVTAFCTGAEAAGRSESREQPEELNWI